MISYEEVFVFLLVLARVSAFIAFFPIFSKRQLPNLIKFGLSASLATFWYLEVDLNLELETANRLHGLYGMALLMKEILIGILLSAILGLFFWPAKIAGAYVGQELGLSLASISDPGSQDSSTLVTRIFDLFSVLMFFVLNLHHFVLMVLHTSFSQLFTRIGFSDLPMTQVVDGFARVSDYGLLLIAPVLVLFLLLTQLLAFLNRAAPTLNLFSVGMSIRGGLGIFLLLVFTPTIVAALQIYLLRVSDDVLEVVKWFV